jgi:hypothetical protein
MKTKVTPVNYIEDLEKIMQDEKCDAVGIDKMSITYIQPADTCCSSDEIQTITITTQCGDCCGIKEAEKQEGCYFDITIPEGQHWSVEDGDSLKALIEDFKKRLYQVNSDLS